MSVGKGIVRRDGPGKVTGRTRYIDDLSEPGMWFGKTVRSTIPHGCIRAIRLRDDFPAEAVVVDYRDIPGKNVIALIEEDQPCLAQERVMHQAEPILLVAAATQEIANRAAAAVEIDYEPKPPIFSIEAALRGEEILFGKDNVFKSFRIEKGSLEAGFAAAERVIEGRYRTGAQEQLYIEPNGMIAIPDGEGGITIKGSMQCPYYVHRAVVVLLGLPPEKVRVIATYPGGGFGGKEEYPR
ncbi:MAG: xanthine dehydrogenase family protein molybdopterin-binding subunit [Deltaproteobacteria bacterium]|nr:MAG: xanthine dehydrogenase family protein molybdopterin-binding subunit [Deltaproteobacteria bacterium]